MEFTAFVAVLLCFVGFRQYLQHHRRIMIHRERMAAIEKGVELAPVEQEIRKDRWNIQRLLLLSGLTWIFLGVAIIIVLSAIMAFPSNTAQPIPHGFQLVGLGPIAIGLPQLIVFLIGRGKERVG